MKIVDLTHCLEDNMPVFPGDTQVKVYEDKTIINDYYYNTRIEAGMHTGTHIDAPRHFLQRNQYICDFPLDRFIGNGCLLDVRGQKIVELKEEYQQRIKKGDIVLLYTGISEQFGQDSYYKELDKQPKVALELAQFLVEREIKMLGMDMATPDLYPFEVHKTLMERDVFIMENLANLDKLVGIDRFEVIALPLKIKAEGSMVRAIARFME